MAASAEQPDTSNPAHEGRSIARTIVHNKKTDERSLRSTGHSDESVRSRLHSTGSAQSLPECLPSRGDRTKSVKRDEPLVRDSHTSRSNGDVSALVSKQNGVDDLRSPRGRRPSVCVDKDNAGDFTVGSPSAGLASALATLDRRQYMVLPKTTYTSVETALIREHLAQIHYHLGKIENLLPDIADASK